MTRNTIILGVTTGVLVLACALVFFGKSQAPTAAVQSAQTPADETGLTRCLTAAQKQYDEDVADWTRRLGGSTAPRGIVDPFKRALHYYEGEKHHCHNFYS